MLSRMDRKYPLNVGDSEAVEILFEKISNGHSQESDERYIRLLKSVQRAMKLHDDESLHRIEGDERRAFTHGLLTGYSVAMTIKESRQT